MSNKKSMILVARTNVHGSDCETDIDVTSEEWHSMNSDEQKDIINEYLGDVVDIYVKEQE